MTGCTSLSNILVFLQRDCEKKHTQKKNIYKKFYTIQYRVHIKNIHQILYNGLVDPFVNFVTVFVLLWNVIFYGHHDVKNKYKIHKSTHASMAGLDLVVWESLFVLRLIVDDQLLHRREVLKDNWGEVSSLPWSELLAMMRM